MALISLKEYAKLHGRTLVNMRAKAERGMFATARKIGRDWLIDSDEPFIDNRVRSGKYVGWRDKYGKSKDK